MSDAFHRAPYAEQKVSLANAINSFELALDRREATKVQVA
jgi:hypothetical protein